MHSSDFDGEPTCNCMKDERKRVAVRRYAGVFVTVLPCGHIVTVRHMVGAESLPQVAISFAAALQAVPGKTFLCYDNACALARYCRNPIRADRSLTNRGLAACTFVLPESHARGHTACMDPDHAHYLPEVKKSAHPALAGVNTEVQEHVFAWSRWLVYVANPMTPARHRAFFALMCIARNEHRPQVQHRPRTRRPWRLWRGAGHARGQSSEEVDGDVRRPSQPEAAVLEGRPVPPLAPVPEPCRPPPPRADFRFVRNARDGKLHRLSTNEKLSCGAALPKRCDFFMQREDAGKHKICLRAGCFSPSACFRG